MTVFGGPGGTGLCGVSVGDDVGTTPGSEVGSHLLVSRVVGIPLRHKLIGRITIEEIVSSVVVLFVGAKVLFAVTKPPLLLKVRSRPLSSNKGVY